MAAWPDFEAAGPDLMAAGPYFSNLGPDFSDLGLDSSDLEPDLVLVTGGRTAENIKGTDYPVNVLISYAGWGRFAY